jgi:hypothetical protein
VKVGVMSDLHRVVLRLNGGTTTEQASDARARVWRYVLDCHAKRKAAEATPNIAARAKHKEEVSNVNQRDQ